MPLVCTPVTSYQLPWHPFARGVIRFRTRREHSRRVSPNHRVWKRQRLFHRIELPYVVIVDISMPDLDGLQATRQIRQATPNTDVVVLTMHESDQMVRLVLDAGALGYVLKSDLAAHLVKAVKDVSAGKLFLTPRESEIVLKGFLKTGNQPDPTEHSQARPTPREVEIIRLLAEENRIRRLLPS